jgi:hypothetical protein
VSTNRIDLPRYKLCDTTLRNHVERCFNKLKCSKRLATRYVKTAASYLDFVQIAAARLWTRQFVNRTYPTQWNGIEESVVYENIPLFQAIDQNIHALYYSG